ncbi:MAG: hypothetical protein PUF72_05030 [Clostridiales bacterium]|nr:hypothetical protein [Clostridiales bacterium]
MTLEGTGNFMRGMAAGVVVGAAVSMMAGGSSRQKNRLQKKAEGVFKNIGDVIDTAVDMIK